MYFPKFITQNFVCFQHVEENYFYHSRRLQNEWDSHGGYTYCPVKSKLLKGAVPTILPYENPIGQLAASLQCKKQTWRREVSIQRGRGYSMGEFAGLKKLLFMSPYLLVIGKSDFLKNLLKLINLGKGYFKESLAFIVRNHERWNK